MTVDLGYFKKAFLSLCFLYYMPQVDNTMIASFTDKLAVLLMSEDPIEASKKWGNKTNQSKS